MLKDELYELQETPILQNAMYNGIGMNQPCFCTIEHSKSTKYFDFAITWPIARNGDSFKNVCMGCKF